MVMMWGHMEVLSMAAQGGPALRHQARRVPSSRIIGGGRLLGFIACVAVPENAMGFLRHRWRHHGGLLHRGWHLHRGRIVDVGREGVRTRVRRDGVFGVWNKRRCRRARRHAGCTRQRPQGREADRERCAPQAVQAGAGNLVRHPERLHGLGCHAPPEQDQLKWVALKDCGRGRVFGRVHGWSFW